ncbi:MAG TPA: hypothetical protein VHK26_09270 [Methyloceanibacter sp.]|jgi:hypothetical protein|nr:hypothetical protein [Methyloceanibacter sp.]
MRKKRLVGLLLLTAVLLVPRATLAQTADGSSALALAALVGIVSPLLATEEKDVLTKLLDGNGDFTFPNGKTISIHAGTVACKAGNISIMEHSCTLAFGKQNVELTGRSAHELYATLIEIGVPPDAGAGSVYQTIANLDCTVDPNEVTQNAGGGAHCDYAAPNQL